MRNWIIRIFGLKGSWDWAVRQMLDGAMVTKKSGTGVLKYRLSRDDQNRLEWDFSRSASSASWENANFFVCDLKETDWIIYKWKL